MRAVPFIVGGMVAGLACVALAATTGLSPLQFTIDGGTQLEGSSDDTGFPDGPTFDGGGFDSTTCTQTNNTFLCGEAGANGCAGFGGGPGTGGQGGGAAIPLYVVGNSHVTMSNGAFFIARGGSGGNGGDGGMGSTGHAGSNGFGVQCYGGCDPLCKPVGGFMLEGGTGGIGTNGGNGGLGGGGNGGPIYFYACIDAAAPTISAGTLDASMIIDGGGPGSGGSPNGKAGAQAVGYP